MRRQRPRAPGGWRAALVLCAGLGVACDPAPETAPGAAAPPAATMATSRPNVVVITIDTLRADHCGVYGYPRPTTPNLDAFAAQGALFEWAYAVMPTTLPSHATLFTSLHPDEHGVRRNGVRTPEDLTTLAELFRENGYETAAFVSSYAVDRRFGLDQGFAHYDDHFTGETASVVEVSEWGDRPVEIDVFDRRAEFTTNAALDWLRERPKNRPFLLWVHYFDPHTPYSPPEPFLSGFRRESGDAREQIVDRYDAEIRYTDEHLGRLLRGLDAVTPPDRTITLVTSDHGEGLWEHGWGEHGVFLYDEATRVPLIMRWSGQIAAGTRLPGIAGLIDVLPTLTALAGLDRGGAVLRGLDLSAALRGDGAIDPDRTLYLQRRDYESPPAEFMRIAGEAHALRWRQWKLIRSPLERGVELYDVERDARELRNAAGLHEDLTEAMSERLRHWVDNQPRAAEGAAGEVSQEDRERLEKLGYVE